MADRAAALLFYVALVAGVLTLGIWTLLGSPEQALIRTATVLVIACPHALGLAIPLVIAISTTLGARNGLLVKDRLALERAKDIRTVIFDKTGTLTRGEPVLSAVASAPGVEEREVLALAAAVEAGLASIRWPEPSLPGPRPRGVEPHPATGFEALPAAARRRPSAVTSSTWAAPGSSRSLG